MSNRFTSFLNPIIQRTGSSVPVSPLQHRNFINSIQNDLNELIQKNNSVTMKMFEGLKPVLQADGKTPLDYGITGEVIYSHRDAHLGSNDIFWDEIHSQPKTIKESFDGLLGKLGDLQIDLDKLKENSDFDSSDLETALAELNSNLLQLTRDVWGSDYALVNNASGTLDYTLLQAIEAIGSAFGGWPGLGVTFETDFPVLSLNILASDITFDVDIPQNKITNLIAHLAKIRTFTGMSGATDDSPTYSSYGSMTYVTDGDSLEESIATLDTALAVLDRTYTAGAIPFGDGTNQLATANSKMHFDNVNLRLGVGTSSPTKTLDVRGIIQHSEGITSYGGNVRGTYANDLQSSRTLNTQVASGNYSAILGGKDCTASGDYALAHGNGSTASQPSAIALGDGNTSSGSNAVAIGQQNTSSGDTAVALGYHNQATGVRSLATGAYSLAAVPGGHSHASGYFANPGDAQVTNCVVRNTTVGATTAELFLNGSTVQIPTADGTSYSIVARVIAKTAVAVGADTNHYILEGTVMRDTGVGSISLLGAITKRIIHEDMAGGDATIDVDTVTGAITIKGTGIAGATIRWVASVTITQVSF